MSFTVLTEPQESDVFVPFALLCGAVTAAAWPLCLWYHGLYESRKKCTSDASTGIRHSLPPSHPELAGGGAGAGGATMSRANDIPTENPI